MAIPFNIDAYRKEPSTFAPAERPAILDEVLARVPVQHQGLSFAERFGAATAERIAAKAAHLDRMRANAVQEQRQPAPNDAWCPGCNPDNCKGCGPLEQARPFHRATPVEHFDREVRPASERHLLLNTEIQHVTDAMLADYARTYGRDSQYWEIRREVDLHRAAQAGTCPWDAFTLDSQFGTGWEAV